MACKILTVDDSTTIRKIVRRALDKFCCDILEAQNGMEGLATANKERPDLIILDITMPVMKGKNTSRWRKTNDHAAISAPTDRKRVQTILCPCL